jgi:putative intracellular protease/amidase
MTRSKLRTLLFLSGCVTSALGFMACGAAEPNTRITFPEVPSAEKPQGKVLFVVSAAREQVLTNGSRRRTGTFLGEFYEPYVEVTEQGYEVVIATVAAAPPAIDPESLDDDYWNVEAERNEALRFVERSRAWREPVSLVEARTRASDFDGLIVPGGQGVMVDLLDNAELLGLLRHFAEREKPVGLVCHAPALLTRLAPPHAFEGRAVTSVSGFEEFYIETFVMGADAKVRAIGDRLEAAGYEHDAAFPGRENALRDCNLVTSQNPFSTTAFSALYLEAMRDYRRGARCVRAP